MPVDASIPLQQNLPRPESFSDTLGKVYQARLAQKQGVAADIQNQGSQLALNDQMALGKAYQANFKNGQFDRGGFEQSVLQSAPRLYPQVVKQGIDQQVAQIGLQKDQLSQAQAHTDYISRHLQGVLGAPPEQKQSAYTASRNQLISEGMIHPGGEGDPGALYPGDDALARLQQQTMNAKDLLEQHAKDLTAKAEALKAQTGVATQQETGRHNVATEKNEAARNMQTAQYQRGELANQRAEVGVGYARVAAERRGQDLQYGSATNATTGQPLENSAMETQAQQVAKGELPLPNQTNRNPQQRAVAQRALTLNPKLSDSLYSAVQDLRDTNKPTSMGGQVTRLGTAILHGDEALRASANLGFSSGLAAHVKTAGTATYGQAAEFLTGEIGQYVEGGKLTVKQGEDLKSHLYSPFQGVRDAASNEIIKLSGGKLRSQAEQFTNATGMEFPSDRVFNDPEIKGALQKHGILGGDKAKPAPPSGATHVVPGSDGKMHYTDGKADLGLVP